MKNETHCTQQNVSAMARWRVAQSFYLRSTFGFVGQDAASEEHHCRNTTVSLTRYGFAQKQVYLSNDLSLNINECNKIKQALKNYQN